MARPCSICSRPDRAEIDAAAVGAEPNRRIATRFRITESSLRRHLESHLPQALVKAEEAREVTQADSLLEKVHRIEADARRLLERAEKEGDLRCAIAAAKTSLDVIDMLVKVRDVERAQEAATGPQKILIEYVDGKDWRSFGRPEIEIVEGRKDNHVPGN
jgi:hypothetical protein